MRAFYFLSLLLVTVTTARPVEETTPTELVDVPATNITPQVETIADKEHVKDRSNDESMERGIESKNATPEPVAKKTLNTELLDYVANRIKTVIPNESMGERDQRIQDELRFLADSSPNLFLAKGDPSSGMVPGEKPFVTEFRINPTRLELKYDGRETSNYYRARSTGDWRGGDASVDSGGDFWLGGGVRLEDFEEDNEAGYWSEGEDLNVIKEMPRSEYEKVKDAYNMITPYEPKFDGENVRIVLPFSEGKSLTYLVTKYCDDWAENNFRGLRAAIRGIAVHVVQAHLYNHVYLTDFSLDAITIGDGRVWLVDFIAAESPEYRNDPLTTVRIIQIAENVFKRLTTTENEHCNILFKQYLDPESEFYVDRINSFYAAVRSGLAPKVATLKPRITRKRYQLALKQLKKEAEVKQWDSEFNASLQDFWDEASTSTELDQRSQTEVAHQDSFHRSTNSQIESEIQEADAEIEKIDYPTTQVSLEDVAKFGSLAELLLVERTWAEPPRHVSFDHPTSSQEPEQSSGTERFPYQTNIQVQSEIEEVFEPNALSEIEEVDEPNGPSKIERQESFDEPSQEAQARRTKAGWKKYLKRMGYRFLPSCVKSPKKLEP